MLGNKARRTWHIALGPTDITTKSLSQTDIPHTARRTPAAPARAPHRSGERGVTVWDGNSPSMLSPGSTTQREMKAVRPTSPAHAPRLTIYRTAHFRPLSLPAHPPRLGPRRAISGDLAPSRAISGPRRAISGDLGASLAPRAAAHLLKKRKGPVGATGLTCSLGAPPHSAPLLRRWRGPVRRRGFLRRILFVADRARGCLRGRCSSLFERDGRQSEA